MRALISVSDKTGVVEFAKRLQEYNVEIISTGGTAQLLEKEQIPVLKVQDITGFPECLDGRVKTLHPRIHAGLLARRDNTEHMNTLKEMDIRPIDLVVVNLYPFKQTVLKEGVTREEAIENIDIGGPSMLRAAAKNYQDVAVVVDPADYEGILQELEKGKGFCPQTKFYLAAKVFQHTAHYDSLIANYLHKEAGLDLFCDTVTLTYEKVQEMRYGENPHQKAAFYKEVNSGKAGIASAKQLHGKELSFNNINDANGALELLKEFSKPTVVASKHANPCGVGTGEDIYTAYKKAYESDPVSVYGGIVVANREIDGKTAQMMNEIFLEIIVAPGFTKEALETLTQKKNIRLMEMPEIMEKPEKGEMDIKKVLGGILVQEKDLVLVPEKEYTVVTRRKPTEQELEDLFFTWKIVKHVKSNGIAIGKDGQSVGIGPGQVNRIWACEQAIDHGMKHLGKDFLQGATLASDAYFPFPDCVEAAAKAGITAIIQPGGSIRDELSIEACNAHNIAMIFTDMRHFKH